MSAPGMDRECEQMDLVHAYALGALPGDEMRVVETHLSACAECRREVELLRPIIDGFFHEWPTMCCGRQAHCGSDWWTASVPISPHRRSLGAGKDRRRIGRKSRPVFTAKSFPLTPTRTESPCWCVLLRGPLIHRTAMWEKRCFICSTANLWIEDTKLYPGDYNRREAGTSDQRVWSETGCTCVLITSARDALLNASSPA